MDKIKDLEKRRKHLQEGGGPAEIEKQHARTKLTVRERLDRLFDKGTFIEDNLWIRSSTGGRELPGDAVVTGMGNIHGRPVFVYAHDFTVLAGTFGGGLHYKVARTMTMARESGLPCIGLVDSAGERMGGAARSEESAGSALGQIGTLYSLPMISSGVVPQLTVMLGPSYAGSAYSPTMAGDFYIMRHRTAYMSVASPVLLKSVTFKDVTQEEIGGSELHATVTGNADFLTETDEEAIEICRDLVSYLPLNNRESPPVLDMGDDPDRRDERLLEIVPPDLSKPYDMHEVIRCIVDKGQFLESAKLYAPSIIICLARLNGRTVGIVANNPAENGGSLNINTMDKETRFIRFCDAFNIPLVFLVDTAGFLSDAKDFYGKLEEQSRDGLLRSAPKAAFAISEATVPMVVVYIGKCFGPALLPMGNVAMGVDFTYSWPSAQVAPMKPEEAVGSIYKKEIESAENPEEIRREKIAELLKKYNYPYLAAGEVLVNDLIDPRDTRPRLIRTLENLAHKKPTPRPWRKHSLIPR